MPLLASTYHAPTGLSNGHVQTIYPAVFRRMPRVDWRRERIATDDGDFLDLDHASGLPATRSDGRPRTAILTHGLEGHSRRRYIAGMAAALVRRGWDVVAWNFRGCGGEPNRLLRSYHSGETGDLHRVLEHVRMRRRGTPIGLVGFSVGGNITLKYLGERGAEAGADIVGAVTFSVPCDLAASAAQLAVASNRIYMRRFLRTLVAKVRDKAAVFPVEVDLAGIDSMRTFAEFDERFTAPIHGFDGAQDYWRRCSSRSFIERIRVRTLIVSARNDPFLTPSCFPVAEAADSGWVHLEMPGSGGHVGFVTFNQNGEYWSERRAAEFLEPS